jgi:membrane associated rhomboid family serine protease
LSTEKDFETTSLVCRSNRNFSYQCAVIDDKPRRLNYLVKPLKFSIIFLIPQGLVAIIYFTYNALAVYIGEQSNVAYISHVIGFLIGVPFGAAWSKNLAKNLLITIGMFIIYLAITIFLIPLITQA